MKNKMPIQLAVFATSFFTSFLLGTSAFADSVNQIARLSNGAPELLGKVIPPSGYVDVMAHKLTKAKVVWINWDYLQSQGFDVGNRTLTPEIEKAIVDAFGYGVRGEGEPANAFGPEVKIFKADIYGGDGLAGNMGSGRAASAGRIQIKGIGKTDLVTTNGPSHSNGTMSLDESIREAIYGEVATMMPYGANRVVAILDRGTVRVNDDGVEMPNSLTVREDPVRPAHFMKNLWGRGPLMQHEDKRVAESMKYFFNAFPTPKGMKSVSLADRTRASVLAYSERIAETYAAGFVRKFYHGATSPSNIESSGREVDYGTATTVPDYGKLKIISINDAVGETKEFKDILLLEVLHNFRDNMPKKMAAHLPSDEEMTSHFDIAYKSHLDREFLRLTGLSPERAIAVKKTQAGEALAELLNTIATKDAREVLDPQTAQKLTRYNLNEILVKITAAKSLDPAVLEEAIRAEMPTIGDQSLRVQLVTLFNEVQKMVPAAERADMADFAVARNASHPEAFRWKLWGESVTMAKNYAKNADKKPLANKIDSVTSKVKSASIPVGFCKAAFSSN